MPCFVYVIGSSRDGDSRTYVGWTTDLDRRLEQHNAGTGAKSTRGRSWTLLYAERFETRGDAMRREWHLKRDRKFRRSLVLAAETPDFADAASGLRDCAPSSPDGAKRNPGR